MDITLTAIAATIIIVVTPETDQSFRGTRSRSTLSASSKVIHPLNGIVSILTPFT